MNNSLIAGACATLVAAVALPVLAQVTPAGPLGAGAPGTISPATVTTPLPAASAPLSTPPPIPPAATMPPMPTLPGASPTPR
jgi:hypothetical protein